MGPCDCLKSCTQKTTMLRILKNLSIHRTPKRSDEDTLRCVKYQPLVSGHSVAASCRMALTFPPVSVDLSITVFSSARYVEGFLKAPLRAHFKSVKFVEVPSALARFPSPAPRDLTHATTLFRTMILDSTAPATVEMDVSFGGGTASVGAQSKTM